MINIINEFQRYCNNKYLGSPYHNSYIQPPYGVKDTLFTIAGVQHYEHIYSNGRSPALTVSVQACLRFNDFDELDKPFKSLYFNMLGLFSFKHWTMQQVIDFWMDFFKVLQIKPDYVTIHPDKAEWTEFYKKHDLVIKFDYDCIWSNGSLTGYCTEFYKEGLEIGNIVSPTPDGFDCGFGAERLDAVVNHPTPPSKLDKLKMAAQAIRDSGYTATANKQGYCLRKLCREIIKLGGSMDTTFFQDEVTRQARVLENYNKLKDANAHQTKEWWWSTHGIDIDLI